MKSREREVEGQERREREEEGGRVHLARNAGTVKMGTEYKGT